ncbi:MAG: dimethylmenaquinone methyltransferase [Planctomycetota bacterium]|nr:MAG: dimethylmenaquinone methyltransferase [Planctomycetota bacterium]
MFACIAPRYDLANRLLSMGLDQRWRAALIEALPSLEPGQRLLDLCTGTGDVAMALRAAAPDGVAVFGSDFCEPMVALAPPKSEGSPGPAPAYLVADALQLPFSVGSFRALSVAFGLRNVEDPAAALGEAARVLSVGGRLLVLEFSRPTLPIFSSCYRFYVFHILPWLGGLLSGSREAYAYLPESVWAWPEPAALAGVMQDAGFRVLRQRPFLGGAVVLHVAERC